MRYAFFSSKLLSPTPLTLDDLVRVVGMTKGALFAHMAQLEWLGLVHRDGQPGDHKDDFSPDGDFWGVVRGSHREREKQACDRALHTVDACLELVDRPKPAGEDVAVVAFYKERILAMQRFFYALDPLVGATPSVEDFCAAAPGKLVGPRKESH